MWQQAGRSERLEEGVECALVISGSCLVKYTLF